ncbi:MAG: sulfotransferase [Sphingobium sp.]
MRAFDAEAMLSAARARTGLSDLGAPDPTEAFGVLVAAMNEQAQIAPDRRDHAEAFLVRLLANRLWMTQDLKDNPQIERAPLKTPVVILPLPRTGSTKLQRLLGASDSFQTMLWWQIHNIARRPGLSDGGAAQRRAETKAFDDWALSVVPDLVKGHMLFADEPEEEQMLNEETFWSPKLSMQLSGLGLARWLDGRDDSGVYDRLVTQLKYIQWQHYDGSRPFLLKSPLNVGKEDQPTRVFGRSFRSICPHRDPVNIVVSIAQTCDYYRQMFSDVPTDKVAKIFGVICLRGFSTAATRHMAWRDANPDMAVLDLAFRDINAKTMDVLEQVYAFLDLDLTDAIRGRVAAWESDGARNKFARGSYEPEQFGLTKAQIHKAFEEYLDRFGSFI